VIARLLASKPAQWAGVALAALSSVPMIGHFVAPHALAECNPQNPTYTPHPARPNNFASYFVGWNRDTYYPLERTRAYIAVKNPHVVIDRAATSYVMLAEGGGDDFARIGWIEIYNNNHRTFAQYTDHSGELETIQFSQLPYPEPGQGHLYEVRVDPENALTFLIDNVEEASRNIYFQAHHAHHSGQITTLGNQMPGGRLSHESFAIAEISFNGEFYESFNPNGVGTDGPFGPGAYNDHFGFSKVSVSRLEVWDQACAT
jgi:hypothetical protein